MKWNDLSMIDKVCEILAAVSVFALPILMLYFLVFLEALWPATK